MSSSPFATRYIVRADQTAGRFVLTERPIPPVQVTSPLEVWLVGGAARGGARPLPKAARASGLRSCEVPAPGDFRISAVAHRLTVGEKAGQHLASAGLSARIAPAMSRCV